MAGTRRKRPSPTIDFSHGKHGSTENAFRAGKGAKFNDPQPRSIMLSSESGGFYGERRKGQPEQRDESTNRRKGQVGTETTAKGQPAFEVTQKEFKAMPKSGRAKDMKAGRSGFKTLKDRRRKDRRQ